MLSVGVLIILYIAKAVIIGCAISVFYIKFDLFPDVKNEKKILLGMSSYPLFSSLCGYILGLIFVGYPCFFFYLFPSALALVVLIYKNNYRIVLNSGRMLVAQILLFIKELSAGYSFCAVIVSLAMSSISVWQYNTRNETFIENILKHVAGYNKVGVVIIALTILCVMVSALWGGYKLVKQAKIRDTCFLIVFFVSSLNALFIGLSFNEREISDVDRSHYELEASYFAEDRDSWEIDNYTDEKVGSAFRDDHGPLWITFLAEPKIISGMLGQNHSVRVSNFAVLCVYLAFSVLVYCIAEHVADRWYAGAMSICVFQLYRYDIFMLQGSRDAFRFVSLIMLLFYSLSCFELFLIRNIKIRYYIMMCLLCFFCIQGHAGNVYLMLGMFIVMGVVLLARKAGVKCLLKWGISVLIGTLIGMSKNISIYLSTGTIKHYGNTVFLGTPVTDYMREASNAEYTWNAIWKTYDNYMFFIMGIGIVSFFFLVSNSVKLHDKKTLNMCLLVVGLLLPLTGIMDWIGYECSKYFVAQPRYRMYFLILAAIIAAINLCKQYYTIIVTKRDVVTMLCSIIVFMIYFNAEGRKMVYCSIDLEHRNAMVADFKRMSAVAETITSKNIFVENQIMMYYLPRRTKLLYDMYSFELIQARSDNEVKNSIRELGLGAVILHYTGIDYGTNYSLLPFWDYINNSSDFMIINQNEWQGIRGYRMFVYVGK